MPRQSNGTSNSDRPASDGSGAKPVNAGELLAAVDIVTSGIDGGRISFDMRLVRSRLHMMAADDPLVDVGNISAARLAQVTGEPRVVSWARHPWFMDWVRAPRVAEERADALFDEWLDQMLVRMRGMADKDYINAGKLLAEIAQKMPQKWHKEKILDEGVSRMDSKAQEAFLLEAVRSLGYTVDKKGVLDVPSSTETKE